MKMFIGRAGEYMDAFSVHLYDGINVTGTDSKRSGSNSEAVLDMIEAYTSVRFGSPKPLAPDRFLMGNSSGCCYDICTESYKNWTLYTCNRK